MNRLLALLIVVVLWAGIFLPGLGSTELRGEEGRRIMPAVTMAEGGDWVVPYVGGEPFLRKPPLVQWCIATSLQVFGHNAWAARLPSVLAILALAVVIVLGTRGWLITEQSLLAAIILLTQTAIVDKCRLAELEAVYLSLSGIAMVLWMSWWVQGRSPWLVWMVPFAFNALALLAKAPLHLLFFYAMVTAATVASGEWAKIWGRRGAKDLRTADNADGGWAVKVMPDSGEMKGGSFFDERVRIGVGWVLVVVGVGWWFFKREPAWLHWLSLVPFLGGAVLLPGRSRPHFAGVALMLVIFGAWSEPYYARVDPTALAETLKHQAVDRFTGADVSLGKWLLNIPFGIGDHLPWILFVPLLWHRRVGEGLHDRGLALLRGGRWAVAGCFVGLLLIPGVLPRYVLPLTAPFSILLAQVLWRCPRWVRRWWRGALLGLTYLLLVGAVAAPYVVASAVAKGGTALNPGVAVGVIFPIFAGVLAIIRGRRRLRATLRLAVWTGLVAVMAFTLYATCAVPWIRLREKLRPFAARIDSALPPESTLVAYSVGDYPPLLAVLFHLQAPYVYAPTEKEAPEGTAYFLLRGQDRKKFEDKFQVLETVASMEGRDGEKPAVVVKATRRKARGGAGN